MVFVKAKVGPPNIGDPKGLFTVQYFDDKGNMTIKSGGSVAWRCNNPGNLLASPYSRSKQRRSIGKAGGAENQYAVYPDYETGREALIVMLKGRIYSPLTLRSAIARYDSTNPKYIDAIVKITKLDLKRKIKSLNKKEFEIFWKAIEKVENWKIGREDFIAKWVISGVHKKRGVITEFLVKKKGKTEWIAKIEALRLAKKAKLHAVLIQTKIGVSYLRPEFGSKPFKIMS